MATIKKQLDLDEVLLDKVQQVVGQGTSLTWLVERLLWELVNQFESSNFSIPDAIKNSTRELEISETSEILSEEP